MGEYASSVNDLKKRLRAEVGRFVNDDRWEWKKPIGEALTRLKEKQLPAVLFGGVPRTLLLRRRGERPRDIDIVIRGASAESLPEMLGGDLRRVTRFGGASVKKGDAVFDVWPLSKTWALCMDERLSETFEDLPKSTFLNLEAVAIDVWPGPGGQRKIYSYEDRFFEGLLTQTIEINYAENPYPYLCVVRSLILAEKTGFAVGSELARFIVEYGSEAEAADLEQAQRKHYGIVRWSGDMLKEWIAHLQKSLAQSGGKSIILPPPPDQQLPLWNRHDAPHINFFVAEHHNGVA